MTPVQIAEKALADAKKQEQLGYRLKDLKDLKTNYEGKCYGSDTFDKYHAAAYRSAVYYEKIFIEEDELYVLEHILSLSHLDAHYKKSMKQLSYSRNINKRQLTGRNEYNASYNIFSGYTQFRHEISLETFKGIWSIGEDVNLMIKKAFNGKLPEFPEYITQGDFQREATIEQCISDMGVEIIDFKQFPDIYRCIEYTTLPMFDSRRWMPKLYAKPILEWHINRLLNENTQFRTHSQWEAINREVKIIKSFISKNL